MKKILIVDDDPIQIKILTTRLGADGFEVVVARDGVQGVSLAQREKPRLILLDIGLPGGDGYLVLKRLKSLGPSSTLPVIAVSGRAAQTDRAKMMAAGADDYFEKPVDYDMLLTRIRELVGGAPARPSVPAAS